MLGLERGEVRLDDGPVAACDRAGELEAVRDRALHQRNERLRRHARILEQPRCRAVERDEVVRGDRGTRVVERAGAVREVEGTQAECLGQLPPERPRLAGLRGDRGPGAVELLRPAFEGEGLQWMDREPALVRVERRERGRAAHMRDPGAGLDRVRRLRDRPVGDAEQDEVGRLLAQLDTALAQAGGHRRADTAATDHVDAVDHFSLQLPRGCRAGRSLTGGCDAPFERRLHLRPVVVDHRVPGGIAPLTLADDHVLAVDALELGR